MMIAHGAAVVRSTAHALITVDLPFGSYQASPEQAFHAAARVLSETGCAAVKLEGGEEMAETVAFLVRRGVPVMGHVGLTPQSVNALGGYRSRGHTEAERDKIMRDGVAIADSGAFSLVIEGVAESLARELTETVAVPTIGIGGSQACDGQILVIDDMLGLFTSSPLASSSAIGTSAMRSAPPPRNMPTTCAPAVSRPPSTLYRAQKVGWVEHSETHHSAPDGRWVSLCSTHPTVATVAASQAAIRS